MNEGKFTSKFVGNCEASGGLNMRIQDVVQASELNGCRHGHGIFILATHPEGT
jgi:hypothetical protein